MIASAWAAVLFAMIPILPVPAGEACDVYIVSGQSNMDGRASARQLVDTNSVLASVQTNAFIYYANPINRDPLAPSYITDWEPIAPGFSVPPGYKAKLPSESFGPELSFAHTLGRQGRIIALIKVTQGGTSLHADWKPGSGYMYRCLTNAVPLAVAKLEDAGLTGTIKGMIWHQGESDVSLGGGVYRTNLAAFITAVRNDLKLPTLPFAVGEIATNKAPSFRQAQQAVAAEVPNTYFVSADGLKTVEGTHFTTESVAELGQRFALALQPRHGNSK